MGGSNDPRYNLSFITQNSVEMKTPILSVSIQYRLSAWGFLGGKEALEGGATNLGFRDQRLALHWIQENIAAFGGDKGKVTIWGESAGAQSVGAQLLAYNGTPTSLSSRAHLTSQAATTISSAPQLPNPAAQEIFFSLSKAATTPPSPKSHTTPSSPTPPVPPRSGPHPP